MIKSIYDLPQKHWNRLKTQITLEVKGKIMNVKNITDYEKWSCRDLVDVSLDYLLTGIYYDRNVDVPTDIEVLDTFKKEIQALAYNEKYAYFKRYWSKLRDEALPKNHNLKSIADKVEGLFWEDRYGNLELVSAMETDYIHNIISLLENPKNTWIKKEDNEEWLKIFYQELDLRVDKAFQEQELGGLNE